MTNPNHTPSPSTITPDSVKERLRIEQAHLENAVANARHDLRQAEKAVKDFRKAVRNGEAECPAFGYYTCGWSDTRHLPNGDSISVECGEDSKLTPDSIASDLLALEAQGVSVEDLLQEFCDEQEERESERYDDCSDY